MSEQEAYKFFYHALMALERRDKKALDYYNQIYLEEWGECGISEQSPLNRVLKQANIDFSHSVAYGLILRIQEVLK